MLPSAGANGRPELLLAKRGDFDAMEKVLQDGGVIGRIPANRLYQPGLAILKIYPQANLSGAGQGWDRVEAIVKSVFRLSVRRPELLVCDDLSSALDVETEVGCVCRQHLEMIGR